VGTWGQLYDEYGITEEEVKNSGARYIVSPNGIVTIGDFSSFKLDVPDATHESSDVGVSAQDIVSNKAIIVDKLPAPEDMEEGKKYITVE
jgi:hypothetical protein